MTIDDFKTGDLVLHSRLGPGQVVSDYTDRFGRLVIIVEYERQTVNGYPLRGEYDQHWFELLPNVLKRLDKAAPGHQQSEEG